jgi:trimethylamine:corrinoid methyltransferase-like protein
MADATTRQAGMPPYDPLSETEAQRILDASFQLMRETGVQFDPDPRVLDLFTDAGCDVARDGLVKFNAEFVRESLASVARSVQLWNRTGSEFIEIGTGQTCFSPGMTCIEVLDTETGERRSSTRKHMRSQSQTKLLDRRMRDKWESAEGTTLYQRALHEARHIPETHEPVPLSSEVLTELRSIVESTEEELGVSRKG